MDRKHFKSVRGEWKITVDANWSIKSDDGQTYHYNDGKFYKEVSINELPNDVAMRVSRGFPIAPLVFL